MSDLYRKDRAWSDQFIPAIQRIIGPKLIIPATAESDMREATDLMIFRALDFRVAARVRRHGYADRYGYEFTIRAKKENGAKTELRKLVDGFGNWFFYAHAAEGCYEFERWMLIDLAAWRAALIRRTELARSRRPIMCGDHRNKTDGTWLKWFDVRSFPKDPPILKDASFECPYLYATEDA